MSRNRSATRCRPSPERWANCCSKSGRSSHCPRANTRWLSSRTGKGLCKFGILASAKRSRAPLGFHPAFFGQRLAEVLHLRSGAKHFLVPLGGSTAPFALLLCCKRGNYL